MFRLAQIALLATVACAAALADEIEVSLVMRDGSEHSGVLSGPSVSLTGRSADGRAVSLALDPPAQWSTLTTLGEIDWLPEQDVFRIRAATFTAELPRLLAPLRFTAADGARLSVEWNRVRRLVLTPVRSQP